MEVLGIVVGLFALFVFACVAARLVMLVLAIMLLASWFPGWLGAIALLLVLGALEMRDRAVVAGHRCPTCERSFGA